MHTNTNSKVQLHNSKTKRKSRNANKHNYSHGHSSPFAQRTKNTHIAKHTKTRARERKRIFKTLLSLNPPTSKKQ